MAEGDVLESGVLVGRVVLAGERLDIDLIGGGGDGETDLMVAGVEMVEPEAGGKYLR